MMEIPEYIRNAVKSTVGYAEAENKESFMIGASVAFSRSEEFYKKKIEELTTALNGWKTSCDQVEKDMRTLVSTIDKYRDL